MPILSGMHLGERIKRLAAERAVFYRLHLVRVPAATLLGARFRRICRGHGATVAEEGYVLKAKGGFPAEKVGTRRLVRPLVPRASAWSGVQDAFVSGRCLKMPSRWVRKDKVLNGDWDRQPSPADHLQLHLLNIRRQRIRRQVRVDQAHRQG